jgi:hypothetical protein
MVVFGFVWLCMNYLPRIVEAMQRLEIADHFLQSTDAQGGVLYQLTRMQRNSSRSLGSVGTAA